MDLTVDDKNSIGILEQRTLLGSKLSSVLTWILNLNLPLWFSFPDILTFNAIFHAVIILKLLHIDFWVKLELATVVSLRIWELNSTDPRVHVLPIFNRHPTCWF